jgi:hypothetical protein
MNDLECGHPAECLRVNEDDESFCAWCEHVDSLRRTVEQLTKQLVEQAVVVNGGEVTINCNKLGYLSVHDGATVKIHATQENMLVYGLNIMPGKHASVTSGSNQTF